MRRAVCAVLPFAALVLVAAAWLWGAKTRKTGDRDGSPGGAPLSTPAAAVAAAYPTRPPTPTPTPVQTPVGPLPPSSVVGVTAEDYRRRARYPRWSRPVAADEEDPVWRDHVPAPVSASGPDGADAVLTVVPAFVSFERPEPVHVYAHVTVQGQRVPAVVDGEVRSASGERIALLTFSDDGVDPDASSGDLLYTAALELAARVPEELSASYLIRVRAGTPGGEERVAVSGFLYSAPHAQLTGAYRDAIEDGNLVVEAEIAVATEGRFHLEGTLYTAGTQPLAWAQQAAALPPGRHWLALRFYGLIIRERGADGPYVLGSVGLATTTQMPNARNRLVTGAHVTAPYRAGDFRGEPYNDPKLLEAAGRLGENPESRIQNPED
jgi:hypothetical protein